jgi:glycosyltransferase involved in cell wall biosynthesis
MNMKIAMFGLKGIPVPAGIERVVEELGSRLVARGHEVVVYVRPHFTPRQTRSYRGIKLVHLPSIRGTNTDTISHSFLASLACLADKPDVIHIHATGNSVFSLMPRLLGIPTIVQSHGLDWQRAKWGWFARSYLKMTDFTTVHFPSATTVVSQKMQHYYQTFTKRSIVYIPNGVSPVQRRTPDKIRRYGQGEGDYIFFAARLVPEKGCHYLLDAFRSLGNSGKKLVIAGDGSHKDQYVQEIMRQASDHILFLGFVTGEVLEELLSNAYLYVLPSEIEGLSVGLLEAMNYGRCCLVSDIEENLEALGNAGFNFPSRSSAGLAEKMRFLLENPALVAETGRNAAQTVLKKYNWEVVTDQYETLYRSLVMGHSYANS